MMEVINNFVAIVYSREDVDAQKLKKFVTMRRSTSKADNSKDVKLANSNVDRGQRVKWKIEF